MRSLFKIHGGKYYLKKWIISHFPKDYQDLQYIEPCGGGANVLLNKLPSIKETYNDLDKSLFELFTAVKDPDFYSKIKDIPYTLETFNANYEPSIKELILRRMSRGGMKKSFSWSERKRGGRPGDENAWITFIKELPNISNRLKNVEILNQHVIDLIFERDNSQVLWYVDPPYLASTRTTPSVYNIEMTEEEHTLLAEVLKQAKGKVLLSGYYSGLYLKLYKGWRMAIKEIANHSSQAKIKERRVECLWLNF